MAAIPPTAPDGPLSLDQRTIDMLLVSDYDFFIGSTAASTSSTSSPITSDSLESSTSDNGGDYIAVFGIAGFIFLVGVVMCVSWYNESERF